MLSATAWGGIAGIDDSIPDEVLQSKTGEGMDEELPICVKIYIVNDSPATYGSDSLTSEVYLVGIGAEKSVDREKTTGQW
jgi:hypothetical protein